MDPSKPLPIRKQLIVGVVCFVCVIVGLVLCVLDRAGMLGRVGLVFVAAPLFGLAIAMMGWLRVVLRVRAWRRGNCCMQCGYPRRSLEGNSTPCPECGAMPPVL